MNTVFVNSNTRKFNLLIIFLTNIVFFFILFPYVSPFRTPFDTQPYALVFSILFFIISLFSSRKIFNYEILTFFFLLVYSIFIFLTRSIYLFSAFRSLVGYFSLFFFTYFGYHSTKFLNPKLFNISVLIWFFFGFIQFFFDKSFGLFLISSLRTTPDRGVTSLAVEPSFYSIICFFMIFINDFFYNRNKINKFDYNFNLVLLFLQIFISFSGFGFFFLIVYLFSKWYIYFFFKKISFNFFVIFFICIILFISFPLILITFGQIRGIALLGSFFDNPIDLIFSDYSFSIRFVHIIISITTFVNNFFGYGLGNWNYYVEELILYSPTWLNYIVSENNLFLEGRILSGWGSLIFELGFFGLIPIILLLKILFKYLSKQNKIYNIFSSFTFFLLIIMFMAIPISYPFFGFTFGILLFFSKTKKLS